MFRIIQNIGFFWLCIILVACGELPKPFSERAIKNTNPLIILGGGGAVRVEVDEALPASLSKPLIENMIESLWEENIPASAAKGFKPRYLLRGEIKILNSSLFEAEKAEIMWTLTEVSNKKKSKFRYKVFGDHPGWLLIDKNPWDNLPIKMGKDVVKHLYKHYGKKSLRQNLKSNFEPPISQNQLNLATNSAVKQPLNSNDSFSLWKKPKVFLIKIVGAPGDGNNSLYKNIRRMLIVAGLNMVNERQRSDFLLNGFVNVSPTYDKLNDIAVTWLLTTKDGLVVGKATQNKRVPAGTVREEWDDVAVSVAVEGSISIVKIVMRHQALNRD